MDWQGFFEAVFVIARVLPNENTSIYTSQPNGSLFDKNKTSMGISYWHKIILYHINITMNHQWTSTGMLFLVYRLQ
jgi:hypothetical protein